MVIKLYAHHYHRWFRVFASLFMVGMIISVAKISQVKEFTSKFNEIKKSRSSTEVIIYTRTTVSKDSYPIEIANRTLYSSSHEAVNVQLGSLDKYVKYRIYENIAVGNHYKDISTEYGVTLASFASIDKLYSILDITR